MIWSDYFALFAPSCHSYTRVANPPSCTCHLNRRIHADVIVYIFAHLHTTLHTEGNMLDMN